MFVDLLNTGTKVFITSMSFESPFSELLHQSFSAQLSEAVIVEYLGCVDFGERLKSNSRPSTFERIKFLNLPIYKEELEVILTSQRCWESQLS